MKKDMRGGKMPIKAARPSTDAACEMAAAMELDTEAAVPPDAKVVCKGAAAAEEPVVEQANACTQTMPGESGMGLTLISSTLAAALARAAKQGLPAARKLALARKLVFTRGVPSGSVNPFPGHVAPKADQFAAPFVAGKPKAETKMLSPRRAPEEAKTRVARKLSASAGHREGGSASFAERRRPC